MPWFKVDDKFHTSEEVMSIPLHQRAAAVGLWTLAGAWSSDHLKDGFVPNTHLATWGADKALADELVAVKLWVRVGRRGFQFRNWDKWQITREAVETNREKERDRKAEWRAAKAAKSGARPGGVPVGQIRSPGGVPDLSGGVPDVSPLSRPDPTRPDPTYIETVGKGGSSYPSTPFCPRHPNGTDQPCGPCRTARMAFEAAAKTPEPVKASKTRAPKPGDGHDHQPDDNGYCPICGERA